MSNSGAERRISVSEELATTVYREMRPGSGVCRSPEHTAREALMDHLGLGFKTTTPPQTKQ